MSIELLRDEAHQIAELSLPGYLFSLLFDSLLRNDGLAVRQDLAELANKASVAQLNGRDRFTQVRLAQKLERDGHQILSAAGVEDLKLLTGSTARWLCAITMRNIPVEENGLMVALAIAAEIDEDEDASWGNPKYMNVLMNKLDNEARKLGYFMGTPTGIIEA